MQTIEINLSDVAARAVIVFNVSGDGTIQMLYPINSDPSPPNSASLRLALRVREPFGAEQVIAITSQERMVELEKTFRQLDQRLAGLGLHVGRVDHREQPAGEARVRTAGDRARLRDVTLLEPSADQRQILLGRATEFVDRCT